MSDVLTIVVPCYNEEEVLPETIARLTDLTKAMIQERLISEQSTILLVDDGSKDKTWELIEQFSQTNPLIHGLKLSRNAGHQNALMAGLTVAVESADLLVSIDADLQDDCNCIRSFVEEYHKGFDIVYGVRSNRDSDTFFKRNTALAFYQLMKKLGVDMVYNHADFRLMSKRAVEALCQFDEVNLFLRGLVPLVGFSSTQVTYARAERFAGTSKYPFKKMLKFALEGITSFSVKPLRLITSLGCTISFISILAALYALISKLFGSTVQGWTSLILSIWFLGGLQLIGMGILGEYIGKLYQEVKHRPKFIIEKKL
ncbi:MAG: glycosyltransferase family 2 protein [Ruminococcaceae bacterium]|nr:glycosyltransferase family 2 protein [Oscillospiraceae bacterium]